MRKPVMLLVLAGLLCAMSAAWGKTAFRAEDEVRIEAEQGLTEILQLWHEKRYDELYEKTVAGGKQTRKVFAGRLAAAPRRPACCWQMMQDVKVTVKNDDNVVVRAKIGLEGIGDTDYRTVSFKLRKTNGVWRASRSDILALSGATKKKRHGR